MSKKNILLELILPVTLLILISVIINITGLDLIFQNKFFSPESGWILRNSQPWKFIYHYGNIPALILSIGALIILLLSAYKSKFNKYVKQALFLILVMAIGPGLLINSVLKDNWGRPRPRNVQDFGGKHQFEQVLTIDPESPGKSFPCGHASMGFYFFVLFFIFRKKRLKLANISLVFALLWGSFIGLARIVQGGHFLSDVIWTAGLMYLVTSLIFFFMKLDRFPEFKRTISDNPISRKRVTIVVTILIIVAVILVFLATPYSRDKLYQLPDEFELSSVKWIHTDLHLLETDLTILGAENIQMDFQAEGFGFPGSKIKNNFNHIWYDSTLIVTHTQRSSGFFTELEQISTFTLPEHISGVYTLNNLTGKLKIVVPESGRWIIIPIVVKEIVDETNYLNSFEPEKREEYLITIKIDSPDLILEITR
jgi:lipid A 4'-phosphatase